MKINFSNRIVQIAVAVISFVVLTFGFYMTLDNRVDTKIKTGDEQVRGEVAQTFEKFQMQQDMRHWTQRIESLRDKKDRIEEDLREEPNDENLRKDLERTEKKLDDAQEKLDDIL